ncbi:hypothetical protein BS78_07G044100 [Paspalum vaginatum]|nr:hypothetical protein BS78_07G044100 [Paspalum vaginatum]
MLGRLGVSRGLAALQSGQRQWYRWRAAVPGVAAHRQRCPTVPGHQLGSGCCSAPYQSASRQGTVFVYFRETFCEDPWDSAGHKTDVQFLCWDNSAPIQSNAAHLVASTKIMTVENQKSVRLSREQKPPSKTTVAQSVARVPTALPAHSSKATHNTKEFRLFSFLLITLLAAVSALALLCRRSSPFSLACIPLPGLRLLDTGGGRSTEMEISPSRPLAAIVQSHLGA